MAEVSEGNGRHYHACLPCSSSSFLLLIAVAQDGTSFVWSGTAFLLFLGSEKWCKRKTDWIEIVHRVPYHCLQEIQSRQKSPKFPRICHQTIFDSKSLSNLMKVGGNLTKLNCPPPITIWRDREGGLLWTNTTVERNCAHSKVNNIVCFLFCPLTYSLPCFICTLWNSLSQCKWFRAGTVTDVCRGLYTTSR